MLDGVIYGLCDLECVDDVFCLSMDEIGWCCLVEWRVNDMSVSSSG